MLQHFETKFEIGDQVFINVNEGDVHRVTNITYDLLDKVVKYQIMDASGHKGWYSSGDLTKDKIYN